MRVHIAQAAGLLPSIAQRSSHRTLGSFTIGRRLCDVQAIPRHAIASHLHPACQAHTRVQAEGDPKLTAGLQAVPSA